nr:hypothetical protein ANI_1_2130014 [Aspergillus niger CBS 513.88]|eukprot:XP_001388510.2 hypothetical protein ANI_1_2130014 [Aspergillus niger CBS 513.88]
MDPEWGDESEASTVGDEQEDTINEIVAEVIDQFLTEFSRQLGIRQPEDSSPPRSLEPKVPETEEEYREYVWSYIENKLRSYYQPGDQYVEEIVKSAAVRARSLTQKYELKAETTPKLAIMALYDFVILYDSKSMRKDRGTRIRALEETCQRVAEIASAVHEQDVYLRFLNNAEDRHLNKLSPNEIQGQMKKIKYSGLTRLGTVLRTKIVEPLIYDPVINGLSAKPVITIVVTDGRPEGEHENCFGETILSCKQRLSELSMQPAGAVFLISRVGNDANAETFLSNLKMNEELQEMLYCCQDQLDERREVFRRAGKDGRYSSVVDVEREYEDVEQFIPWVFQHTDLMDWDCTQDWPEEEHLFKNLFASLVDYIEEQGHGNMISEILCKETGISNILKPSETITLPRKSWRVSKRSSHMNFIYSQSHMFADLMRNIYYRLDDVDEEAPRLG